MPQGPLVFLNGQMLPAEQARLNLHDMGLILGATVAEMARTFSRRLFRLDSHLDRLARSLACVGFDVGMPIEELGQVAEELVTHNAAQIDANGELGLILFVTAGENPMYAAGPTVQVRTEPTVCIHTFRLPLHVWSESMRVGARLVTPSVRHIPPCCIPADIKHRSRIHYYLAAREAHSLEPGAVPLLLDLHGNVAETNTANVLIVEDGTLVSPTLTNILPGISREMLFELAGRLAIPFAERDFDPSRVAAADEALLASTPYCVMPAVRIDGRRIGAGQPGPVFRRLIDAWSETVGLDVYRQVVEVG